MKLNLVYVIKNPLLNVRKVKIGKKMKIIRKGIWSRLPSGHLNNSRALISFNTGVFHLRN